MFVYIGLILILLITWQFAKKHRQKQKFPSGPWPLPILGNILSFEKSPHLTLCKWAQTHGKIYQMYILGHRHIVLSDLELIKTVYNDTRFIGRPRLDLFDFGTGAQGIIFSEGREWQEQRRFTLRHLRDFGFGRNYMEELIMEEVDEVLEWAESHAKNKQPTTMDKNFMLAVLNSLWRIITGQRFKHNDPKLLQLYEQLFLSTRGTNPVLILSAPKLAKLFPNLSGWNKLREAFACNAEFVKVVVQQHQMEFSKELQQNPRDFIDAYLTEISRTTDPTSSFFAALGNNSLVQVVLDLFQAGSFTTSTMLQWLVLFMILHVKVQEKLQQEIDVIIGSSRRPSLADKPRMMYTEAVILETLRKSSLVPVGVFHTATERSTFEGFDIPKDTVIVANQYFVHHDPEVWGDPEVFRPERFIDSDGKIIMKDRLVPFSTGKRICLGESLARDELFLFTTSLFQKFDIRYDPAQPVPSMTPVPVLEMLEPQPFYVVLHDRAS